MSVVEKISIRVFAIAGVPYLFGALVHKSEIWGPSFLVMFAAGCVLLVAMIWNITK